MKLLDDFLAQNNIERSNVKNYLEFYLAEDLGFDFKINDKTNTIEKIISSDKTTTTTIANSSTKDFEIFCKDKQNKTLMLSGIAFVLEVFEILGLSDQITYYKNDGDILTYGDIVFKAKLNSNLILAIERTLLNIVQQCSGVATNANKIQSIVNTYCKQNKINQIKVLDTRKTMLGSRLLQKYSVYVAGAKNHRFALYDRILIKDNHIDANGGIEKLINILKTSIIADNALKNSIEIECQNNHQVDIVLQNHHLFKTIMLDNFLPSDVALLAGRIKNSSSLKVEVSGGINESNIVNYCCDGVDFISLGLLTHSVKSIDFSLDIK